MNKNLPFTANTKMADVIHRNYILIPVINRFGIKFGFGNKTVIEVCDEYNLNVSFFLEIINSYHNPNYFPKEELQNYTSYLIIQYLRNAHSYYCEVKVPEIQDYIDKISKLTSENNLRNIQLINNFFKEYRLELKKHLDNEEDEVFPYIISLEEAFATKYCSDILYDQIVNESIEKYEINHDSLEIKLGDLKNLLIKFLPPEFSNETCQQLLAELFRLESDLENHTRIEEKVLVPKVKLLEQKVLEASGRN